MAAALWAPLPLKGHAPFAVFPAQHGSGRGPGAYGEQEGACGALRGRLMPRRVLLCLGARILHPGAEWVGGLLVGVEALCTRSGARFSVN